MWIKIVVANLVCIYRTPFVGLRYLAQDPQADSLAWTTDSLEQLQRITTNREIVRRVVVVDMSCPFNVRGFLLTPECLRVIVLKKDETVRQ